MSALHSTVSMARMPTAVCVTAVPTLFTAVTVSTMGTPAVAVSTMGTPAMTMSLARLPVVRMSTML